MGDNEYSVPDLDSHEKISQELKKLAYKDFEDMVYKMELQNSEVKNIPVKKCIDASSTGLFFLQV